MVLQEDLRQANSIHDYKNNHAEMIDIHKQIITDLENKISDLKDRKSFHKKQADSNEANLNQQHTSITNDIEKRSSKHEDEVLQKKNLISSQLVSQSDLNGQKNALTNNICSLNINISENRINYDNELNKRRVVNESSLKERESKIESLSESVAKSQNECINNINDIRYISNEKNSMANYLINY